MFMVTIPKDQFVIAKTQFVTKEMRFIYFAIEPRRCCLARLEARQ